MNRQPDFLKNARFNVAILLYLSLMERTKFMKLKNAQLFYLAIKLMKPFAVPRACTRWKTKRGIGIILFRTENYADVIDNFQWATYVYK